MNRSKFPPIVDWIDPGSRRRRSGGFGDEERQAGCAVSGIRIRARPGSSPQWVRRERDGQAGAGRCALPLRRRMPGAEGKERRGNRGMTCEARGRSGRFPGSLWPATAWPPLAGDADAPALAMRRAVTEMRMFSRFMVRIHSPSTSLAGSSDIRTPMRPQPSPPQSCHPGYRCRGPPELPRLDRSKLP